MGLCMDGMGRWQRMGVVGLLGFWLMVGKVQGVILPKDLPTIEALIALHKAIKKEEDEALKLVSVSFGEQSLVTKGTERFFEVRTTLDSKLNNVHSYVLLAASLTTTANALYQLGREYKLFTKNTMKMVKKKPFVAWYFTDASVAVSREMKHCYKLFASMSTSGLGLMKASMAEKLELLLHMRTSIERARGIVDQANLYCFLITNCGWKPDYIWEILNSNVKEGIADKLTEKWKQGYAK